MPLLDTFTSEQEPLACVLPRTGPLDAHAQGNSRYEYEALPEASRQPSRNLLTDKMWMVLLNEMPAFADVDRFACAQVARVPGSSFLRYQRPRRTPEKQFRHVGP